MGKTATSDNHVSFFSDIGAKGQSISDPLSWLLGDKWTNLVSYDIPEWTNSGLSTVMQPFEKVDKAINPARKIPIIDSAGDVIANKPGDAIGVAVGGYFAAPALGGAGAGAGTGGAGTASGISAGEAAGSLGGSSLYGFGGASAAPGMGGSLGSGVTAGSAEGIGLGSGGGGLGFQSTGGLGLAGNSGSSMMGGSSGLFSGLTSMQKAGLMNSAMNSFGGGQPTQQQNAQLGAANQQQQTADYAAPFSRIQTMPTYNATLANALSNYRYRPY